MRRHSEAEASQSRGTATTARPLIMQCTLQALIIIKHDGSIRAASAGVLRWWAVGFIQPASTTVCFCTYCPSKSLGTADRVSASPHSTLQLHS
jgi:hypothetical protein